MSCVYSNIELIYTIISVIDVIEFRSGNRTRDKNLLTQTFKKEKTKYQQENNNKYLTKQILSNSIHASKT